MPIFWSEPAVLPHIILFLRHCVDFVGYLIGGQRDVMFNLIFKYMTKI